MLRWSYSSLLPNKSRKILTLPSIPAIKRIGNYYKLPLGEGKWSHKWKFKFTHFNGSKHEMAAFFRLTFEVPWEWWFDNKVIIESTEVEVPSI